jgi:hypothetical protein
MNRLSFEPASDPPGSWIMPFIDGVALSSLVHAFERDARFDPSGGYGGFVPQLDPESIDPSAEDLARSRAVFGRTIGGDLRVLECTCGVEGCWPLLCRTVVLDAVVQWDRFCQPHRPTRDYSGFGPFSFDLDQYVATLRSVPQADREGTEP